MEPNQSSTNTGSDIDLRYYLHLLRTNWWLIALAAITAGLAAYFSSQFIKPVYRSTTTLYIDAGSSTSPDDYSAIRASESLAQTYAEMLLSRDVLEQTATMLNLDVSPQGLRSRVQTDPVIGTQLIRIRVEDTDPQAAANIANALSQVFVERLQVIRQADYAALQEDQLELLQSLEEQIAQTTAALDALSGSNDPNDIAERNRLQTLLSTYNSDYTNASGDYNQGRLSFIESSPNVRQVEAAVPGTRPVRPNILFNTLIGFFLGLVWAVGMVLVRSLLDDTVGDPEQLARRHNLPIVGQIGHFVNNQDETLVMQLKPRSAAAEAFRSLRLNIRYASVDHEINSLLITSAMPSEGKTTVAANLAIAMAQGGRDTTLIDADLRRPKVHRVFKLSNLSGLSDLFLQPLDYMLELVSHVGIDRLFVMVSGPPPPNPSELLDTEKMQQILDMARGDGGLVIVDAPPLLGMSDSIALSQHVDGVIFVVRAGQTSRRAVQHAVRRLQQVGANIIGFVLTDIDNAANAGYYQYYYGAGYNSYKQYFDGDSENGDSNQPPTNGSDGSNGSSEKRSKKRTPRIGKTARAR